MRQLLYVSTISGGIVPGDLDDILTLSRAGNPLLGIGGMLLHIPTGFLQILEGEERPLRELYLRIAADRRHTNVRLLLDRDIPRPTFAGCGMAFERPCPDEAETAGMYGVACEAIEGRLSPRAGTVVAVMLETFYRVQRNDLLLARAR